jgi:O-antigen/teichoic acid export membrane protein
LLGSAYVCSIACTALGRPDLPARITLAIAAPYMALIVVLIKTEGVTGAAVGYALRGAVQLALYTWAFANLLRSQVQRLRGDG